MTPKPKKPPDPSQPPAPSSFLILFHSYPLSLHSPSLNLANYTSCETHFPITQPYTRLSSAPIITIGSASIDEKMAQPSALALIPNSLIPPVSLYLKLSAGHLRRLEPRSALGASWCIIWHDSSGRGMGIGIALCFIQAIRGPRSVRFVRHWQVWYVRLIRFNLFSLLFFRLPQVRSPLPPLLTIFMGKFRAFFSIAVWCFLFECCVCWIGLPRFSWLWISLWLICLSGIALLEIVVIGFLACFLEPDCLYHLLFRNLAHPMDSILDILGHLLPCFTKIGGWYSSGYNCFWVVCVPILFSTIWCVVWGWVLGLFDKGYDDCHCGEWIWPHRTFALINNANQLLCIPTQRHHVVMYMLACRLPCYFDWHNRCLAFLGIGSRRVPGSAANLSVASLSGEQPWQVALGFLLPISHGSMMSISLPEMFSSNSFSFPSEGFSVQFSGSFCGKFRNFLFKHLSCFGFFHSSKPGNCASAASFRQCFKCFRFCRKDELTVMTIFVYCSLVVAKFLCRITCHLFEEETLQGSADTYWWLWISMSLFGDVCCNCKRPQFTHTFQVNEKLSWIGNSSTLAHMLLRQAKKMHASTRVIGTQDHVLGPSTYTFWLYFAKYWVYMLDNFLLPIIHDKDVN